MRTRSSPADEEQPGARPLTGLRARRGLWLHCLGVTTTLAAGCTGHRASLEPPPAPPSAQCVRAAGEAEPHEGLARFRFGGLEVVVPPHLESSEVCQIVVGIGEAQRRFAELLDAPIHPAAVVFAPTADPELLAALSRRGARWISVVDVSGFARALDGALGTPASGEGRKEASAEALRFRGLLQVSVARHEAAHMMLHEHVPHVPRPGERTYGTRLPDYLDELVAMMAEPDALLDGRLSNLACNPSILQPGALNRVLSMSGELDPEGVTGSGGVRSRSWARREPARLASAYDLIYALGSFLRSRHPDAIASLVRASMEGTDFGAWLAREGEVLGLPVKEAALERAWLEWGGVTAEAAATRTREAWPFLHAAAVAQGAAPCQGQPPARP